MSAFYNCSVTESNIDLQGWYTKELKNKLYENITFTDPLLFDENHDWFKGVAYINSSTVIVTLTLKN